MKVLFYASKPDKFAVEITSVNAFSFSQSYDFHPVYNKASLVHSIQTGTKDELVAILTADSDEELTELVSLKQVLHTVPVVLVVSGESSTTIQEAQKLHPRFVTTSGKDFSAVLSVVKNIVKDCPKSFS